MHIYFSGIGGVAIGPLAKIARDLGHEVTGSDQNASQYTKDVEESGIKVIIGQNAENISAIHQSKPIDWFIYTAGLPDDHPELIFARDNGIKLSKRHEFINTVIRENDLKLISIAGTHGKTNTTGMMIWALQKLGVPISYSIGTILNFANNGVFDSDSKYFVYEADEFDRNFLHYSSAYAIITSADYDHPDSYDTVRDYKYAFAEFIGKSTIVTTWESIKEYLNIDIPAIDDSTDVSEITLPGEHIRKNAWLVYETIKKIAPNHTNEKILNAINSFPGTQRRMEELGSNLYSDYAHHPNEIRAAINQAREINPKVVAVYQPHQNVRQHHIQHEYKDCFNKARHVLWLPTYLSREDSALKVLTPDQLIGNLDNPEIAEPAQMDNDLVSKINELRKENLVLLMSAGDLDEWAREKLA